MANDDTPSAAMPDEYDRLMGLLDGLNGVTKTHAKTINIVPTLGVGGTRTYFIQTYRQRDEHDEKARSRDTVFLVVAGPQGFCRHAFPAEVADAIARQRESLGTIVRKRGARERAATRKAAGWTPNLEGLRRHQAKRRKKGRKK
jgi:hypothetical protein